MCPVRASLFVVVGRQVPLNSPNCLSAQVRCCCGVSLRQLAHTCCRRSLTCKTGRRHGCVGECGVADSTPGVLPAHPGCAPAGRQHRLRPAALTPAHLPPCCFHTCMASSTSRGASSASPRARTPCRRQQAGPAQRAHSRRVCSGAQTVCDASMWRRRGMEAAQKAVGNTDTPLATHCQGCCNCRSLAAGELGIHPTPARPALPGRVYSLPSWGAACSPRCYHQHRP